jgi:hypothetical protein
MSRHSAANRSWLLDTLLLSLQRDGGEMAEAAFAGRCHCGAIRFVYRTALAPRDWSVRACQCSFCRAHGVVSTSDPRGSFELLAAHAGSLQRYRFGQRSADFLLCRTCGVYVAAVMATQGRHYAVINVRALESAPQELPAAVALRFDGEQAAQRIARRLQRWTPVVGHFDPP